uniref:Gustatory receptor n=1 Tax=Tetranychus urticae TaxID=32264 RepID=T1K0S0_TETUR
MNQIVFQLATSEVEEEKKSALKKLFFAIIGWPSLNIEHSEAARAIKVFIFYGQLLLVYQNGHDISSKPTKWFTISTISVDFFIYLTLIRLIVNYFINDSIILVCLGDVLSGWDNGYPIGILSIIGITCLGTFRSFSCYQARNGSLAWFRVIEEASIHGFTSKILNMKTVHLMKFRQQIVFLSRQIIGASIVPTTIWIACYVYLLYSSPLTYLSIQSPLYFICFVSWQLISIIAIIFIVPQVAWFAIMIIMSICYLNKRIHSVYDELSSLSNINFVQFYRLHHKQVSVLNEIDYINNLLRYIFLVGYYAIGLSGEVTLLYSYLNLFDMPIADRGLWIVGSNTIFQIGLASYLAGKILVKHSYSYYQKLNQKNFKLPFRVKLKFLELLNRLDSPNNGFWIGDVFIMDNLSFVQYCLETCSNMMLFICNLPALVKANS